jgi:hypothetical protein
LSTDPFSINKYLAIFNQRENSAIFGLDSFNRVLKKDNNNTSTKVNKNIGSLSKYTDKAGASASITEEL